MYLIFGKIVFAFFPGFILGYLIYGSMHYAIHAWNPPFKWMKGLWRNHHLHHYKNDERGFGVSSTLWDHVFGTMFDLKKEKEDKEKVQELMFNKYPKGSAGTFITIFHPLQYSSARLLILPGILFSAICLSIISVAIIFPESSPHVLLIIAISFFSLTSIRYK